MRTATTTPDAAVSEGVALSEGERLVVPVLAAGGGSGRSTTAGLLALALSEAGRTVVVDTVELRRSPWAAWVDRRAAGTASLTGHAIGVEASAVFAAASLFGTGGGRGVQVLCDVRDPVDEPARPHSDSLWPTALIAAGGWRLAVIDTGPPLLPNAGGPPDWFGLTAGWPASGDVVPVFSVSSSGTGIAEAATVVTFAEEAGLAPARGCSRWPTSPPVRCPGRSGRR